MKEQQSVMAWISDHSNLLTPAQRELADRAANGLDRQGLAKARNVSVRTVDVQIADAALRIRAALPQQDPRRAMKPLTLIRFYGLCLEIERIERSAQDRTH